MFHFQFGILCPSYLLQSGIAQRAETNPLVCLVLRIGWCLCIHLLCFPRCNLLFWGRRGQPNIWSCSKSCRNIDILQMQRVYRTHIHRCSVCQVKFVFFCFFLKTKKTHCKAIILQLKRNFKKSWSSRMGGYLTQYLQLRPSENIMHSLSVISNYLTGTNFKVKYS